MYVYIYNKLKQEKISFWLVLEQMLINIYLFPFECFIIFVLNNYLY